MNNDRKRPDHESDDQLRPDTANEALRQAKGDPDMDLNKLRENEVTNVSRDEMSDPDKTGPVSDRNDASGVGSGGYTDMDDQARGSRTSGHGTGLTSKKSVTGSDYDGQNSSS